jgi:hypothetical protein
MPRLRRVFAALPPVLIAAWLAAPALGSGQQRGEIVEYGLYETKAVGSRPAGQTATGNVASIGPKKLIEKTDVIPGMLGRSLGLVYRLPAHIGPAETLTFRVIHPPITNPETGKTWDKSEWTSEAGSRESYVGYTFDYRWEIAEGPWTIQILHEGKVVVEKTFKVIVPLN